MNKTLVGFMIGKILCMEGAFMLLPLAVSFYYGENACNKLAFAATIAFLFILGGILMRWNQCDHEFRIKEGFAIVSLSWFLLSIIGGMPFVIAGHIPSVIDASFEIASGFTTTGASILTNVEVLPRSMLFWRSFTHFIGGMGILVFALSIVSKTDKGSVNIMKAEVPGPVFGKLVSKVGLSAKMLYRLYTLMTIVLILLLIVAGMEPFDATIHAFGTAGTGGFGIKAQSVGYYQSPAIHYIIAVGMIAFGVNFNLYFLLLSKKIKDFCKSEELRLYLLIIGVAIVAIMLSLRDQYQPEELFRHSFFTVSSIITTTGYSTVDFGQWPLFAHVVLLLLMFTGAMAGSTAGGIKMSRVLILIKSVKMQIMVALNPRRVVTMRQDDRPVSDATVSGTMSYLVIYTFLFIFALLVVSVTQKDFLTAFSAVAATLNNIGPGMEVVGPAGSYAGFSDLSKIVLTICMIAGRLEIIPLLTLLSARAWKDRD